MVLAMNSSMLQPPQKNQNGAPELEFSRAFIQENIIIHMGRVREPNQLC